VRAPSGLKAGERKLATPQVQLFQTKTRAERARLLDQIFVAEEQLAPLTTAFFDRTRRTTARRPITLRDVQRALRDDELGALAAGADVGESLRRAKPRMLELFGSDVAPKLWSGLLVYGDTAVTIASGPQTGM
jgi:hypothetical protein